ncbi:MAG: hypothetical protein KGH61_01400 [Candidatus Micrarchaeota archaeon]|nr:hypothetical protein [Candidatus Micrarchaeota archaeon]MDE1847586.1 hypothetical protein [Candidatus Micrarchaeota archaeon]MDE1864818.1 hypothetical protein [Candidatus Micrarchaeota archaeon]
MNTGYVMLSQAMPIFLGALILLATLRIRPGNQKLRIRHTYTDTAIHVTPDKFGSASFNIEAAKLHNYLYENLLVNGIYLDNAERKRVSQVALERFGIIKIIELDLLQKLKINSRKLILLASFPQKDAASHLLLHKSKASAVLLSYAAESNLEVLVL